MIRHIRNGKETPIVILTGYHGRLRRLEKEEIVPVNISVFGKPWFPKDYITEKRLAPKSNMLRIGDEEYTRKFKEILNRLHPFDILESIVDRAYSYRDSKGWVKREELVISLNCYEMPHQFCHRRLVAKWIEDNTGEKIVEFQQTIHSLPEPRKAQKSLFE